MQSVLQAGSGKSQDHRAMIVLETGLRLEGTTPPGDYKFFVCTVSGLAGPAGAHIQGFNLGGPENKFITAFYVWTDEAVVDFAWMVVGNSKFLSELS